MKTLFSFAPCGECLPPRPFGAFRTVRYPGKGPVRPSPPVGPVHPVCKGPVRPSPAKDPCVLFEKGPYASPPAGPRAGSSARYINRNPQPRSKTRSPGVKPAAPEQNPRHWGKTCSPGAEPAALAQNPQSWGKPRAPGGSRPYIKEETLASRQGISLVRLVRSMRVGNPTFDRTNVARILVKNKFSTRFFTKKR